MEDLQPRSVRFRPIEAARETRPAAALDFEPECELERFSNSDLEPEAETLMGEVLHSRFRQQREPYVSSLKYNRCGDAGHCLHRIRGEA
jgi:hypothetical protein